MNESAPPGKELKYARVELERRFLLAGVPPQASARDVALTDHYITGTRLRVRCAAEVASDGAVVYKLTQKVPGPGGRPGLITTIYLDSTEYEALTALPAAVIRKVRHSLPPLGVDEFRGPLSGLCLAEAEFDSEAARDAFVPPGFMVVEVTADPRFAGGHLATATREEVARAVAEFGLILRP